MKLNDILSKFETVRRISNNSYQCHCPAHADSKASLTITEKDDKILLYCHAGCSIQEILKSIQLSEKDLFNNIPAKTAVVAEYIYRDEGGKPLYKVIRLEPKEFLQAKYNNGKWVFKMDGTKYVPYNLPNVIKSDEIYFVEGEKDADNLNKIGLVATTTVSGASSFNKHKDAYIQYLKGKNVYIIPDNDDAGHQYAISIMKASKGIAKSVKILNLSKEIPDLLPKSDISDVIQKYGKEKSLQIINSLKKYVDFSIYSGQQLNLKMIRDILSNLSIAIRYNEITKETEVEGMPKEYSEDSGLELLPAFISEICLEYHIKYKEKDIKNELLLLSDSNKYNPIQDMLTKNKWDNKDRFPILFEILGITADEFSTKLVRKWIYQTAMIVFNNKENLLGIDGVLVFQGRQGVGKTRFIRNLALNSDWFKEGAFIDLNDKDSRIEASKGWIVELGELDTTLKKKQSALKAFLTNTMDEVRVPYAQKSTKKPRRTSFFASVNPQEFLVDETGNRRYWVVKVDNIDNERLEKLGKNFIIQLWIQAYNEIKENPQGFRLTAEEKEQLNSRNNDYSEYIDCEEEITLKMDFTSGLQENWTTVEINEMIFDNKSSSTKIGRAMSKIRNKYPEFVSINKTNKGRIYTLPIKK